MIADLLNWKPLEAGRPATPLSLTADEGTWIKLADFKTHLNVVLVFFRRMDDDATQTFLRALQAQQPRFEDLECGIFGVHTARTDKLRRMAQLQIAALSQRNAKKKPRMRLVMTLHAPKIAIPGAGCCRLCCGDKTMSAQRSEIPPS